jgi:hypothetical protein
VATVVVEECERWCSWDCSLFMFCVVVDIFHVIYSRLVVNDESQIFACRDSGI